MKAHSVIWDRIGIGLSGVCIVHCLALPVMLATLPLWPVAEEVHAWMHPVFAVLLVPTTLLAAWTGWREHGRKDVVVFLTIGLIVVLAAGVLGHRYPGSLVETLLTMAGSGLLVTGHWRNWQACRTCKSPAHAHHHASPQPDAASYPF